MSKKLRLTANETPFNRLNKEQIKNPHQVICDFFDYQDNLKEIRADLWEFMLGFFGSDYADGLSKYDRDHYIFFIEKIECLIEAAYILNLKQKKE